MGENKKPTPEEQGAEQPPYVSTATLREAYVKASAGVTTARNALGTAEVTKLEAERNLAARQRQYQKKPIPIDVGDGRGEIGYVGKDSKIHGLRLVEAKARKPRAGKQGPDW